MRQNKERIKSSVPLDLDSKEEDIASSFSQELWNECLQIGLPQNALKTEFIKGIQNGSLSVESYGPFFIQDIAYLQHGSELWRKTAIHAKQQEKLDIADYCNARSKKWSEYAISYAKHWHVKHDGIVLGEAICQYLEYEQYIVNKYGPQYIFVVVYGCLKLWPYIGNELKLQQNDIASKSADNNLYQFWIDENLSCKSAVRNETWMDTLYNQNKIDKHLSFEIVCNCLKLEINFFKEACNEKIDIIYLYGNGQTQIINDIDEKYMSIDKEKENKNVINVLLPPPNTKINRSKSLPMHHYN